MFQYQLYAYKNKNHIHVPTDCFLICVTSVYYNIHFSDFEMKFEHGNYEEKNVEAVWLTAPHFTCQNHRKYRHVDILIMFLYDLVEKILRSALCIFVTCAGN